MVGLQPVLGMAGPSRMLLGQMLQVMQLMQQLLGPQQAPGCCRGAFQPGPGFGGGGRRVRTRFVLRLGGRRGPPGRGGSLLRRSHFKPGERLRIS